MNTRRKDLGAPVDGFFARQPAHLKPITDALRKLVAEAAPKATGAIKWGMPFYELDGVMLCAIGAHKKHVNLILPGAPDDPGGLLEGEGKTVAAVFRHGAVIGLIASRDEPRGDAARAVAELKQLGVRSIMLTGDNGRTAAAISGALGMDHRAAGDSLGAHDPVTARSGHG